jgi:hypothetical protein
VSNANVQERNLYNLLDQINKLFYVITFSVIVVIGNLRHYNEK